MAARNAQAPETEAEEVEAEEVEAEEVEAEEVEAPKVALVVTGALAIVKEVDGKVKYLYRGASVPESLPAEEVGRLTELGLIGSE